MTHDKWVKLTPEEQRVKVAELCRLDGLVPGNSSWRIDEKGEAAYIPDYLNDLNAMHEAEMVIPDAFVRRRYYQVLDKITGDQWNTIVATAAQRAEALVLTLEPE